MLIYGIVLVGSSFTYELLDYKLGLPYLLVWLSDGTFWGVFNFFALSWYAMRQTEIT